MKDDEVAPLRDRQGIPGIQGGDHFGFTVPDMEEAHTFLVEVLGAIHVYSLPGKSASDGWMQDAIGVHPRSQILEIRFYRLVNGANFEVFTFDAPSQKPQPNNSDIGGHHFAFYVDDLDKAVKYLKAKGVEVFSGPTESQGPAQGQRWIYFRAPWGMQFELVSYPDGKAYEMDSEVHLWHPKFPDN